MDLTILYVVLAGLGRSVFGWLENALKDGVISEFELRQLAETIIRVGVMGIAAGIGLNVEFAEASGIAILGDLLIKAFQSKNQTYI